MLDDNGVFRNKKLESRDHFLYSFDWDYFRNSGQMYVSVFPL